MRPSRGRGRQKTEDLGDRSRTSPQKKGQGSRLSKSGDRSERTYSEKRTSREGAPVRGGGRTTKFGDRAERTYSDKRTSREGAPVRGGGRFAKPNFNTSPRNNPGIDDRGEERRPFKGGRPYRSKPSERRESRKSSGDRRIRLNRFMSNAGIASRREADQLIELGLVQVNGKVVREMGVLVDPQVDTVKYDDRVLRPEKFRYVLLNKPKDFITTIDDPQERRTVMELVAKACKERIYPVGRLDRQTTGLLLFTNDGDLVRKLTHPKFNLPKLYHVETTSKVKPDHLDDWRKGVHLEDGLMKVEEVSFVDGDMTQIGMKIHTGKNRVVRRLFEHFGYTVRKLDRVMLGSLTKKDLPRGRYRHLTDQEVAFLKMMK